jgi:pyruvate/2-oxoglutarate dehydrogenase complex dihydrolipoamide dehydrogenase (E3) component
VDESYDLVIIGGGSGGLTAAGFAAQLGVRVALVEKHRIGGDCTWTGCVPSKALLKAAKVAHEARTAARYGICTAPPTVDMSQVREYLRRVMAEVYQYETPEQLAHQGVEVIIGAARFLDAYTVQAGERTLSAKKFIVATGAHPLIPDIPGLQEVSFLTYLQIFNNDRLPERLLIVGAGPIGVEMAQAYQRLGSQVILVGNRLLPKDEPEAAEVLGGVFAREGIQFVLGRATSAHQEKTEIVINVNDREFRGDMLLVATGRVPAVEGLDLDKAGVAYSRQGIQVDDKLRTNVKHIYAAGDCVGSYQFTHLAGQQGFRAVRNALLPGSSSGFSDWVPWTTFTDPEVAHVGLTEAQAREKSGPTVRATRWNMERTDRAVCENDRDGFVKVVYQKDGTLLGATVVAGRAGEVITEFVQALKHGLKVSDLMSALHVYPTYSTAVMQLAADIALDDLLTGLSGKVIRRLSKCSPWLNSQCRKSL